MFMHSAVFAVVRCPSLCHVDVSKRPILLSNFFIAWWPHHSSFPKGDPTVKFRRVPSTGALNRGGVYQKFAIFNQYFRNTDRPTDTEYRGISKYRYRIPNRHEKNTDENTEYRYRLQIPIPTQL